MNWRSATLALIVLCTAITIFYLYLRQTERVAVGWLSAFVIAGAVSAIPMVIGFAGAYDLWPGLTFLPTQMAPLYGPLIFLHARALMIGGRPGKWLWLLAPGGFYWTYQVWAFFYLGDYRSKWAFNDALHEPVIVPLVFCASLGLIIWALIAIWRMRGKYLKWLAEHRSDGDKFKPVWLTHFMWVAIPLATLWGVDEILSVYFGLNYFEQFWADFFALLLFFLISVEALARISSPFPKMEKSMAMKDEPELVTAAKVQGRNWSVDAEKLKQAVLEHEWHLEASLSLSELAQRMGTNQAYLSRTINQGMGESFSHFINGLRVRHAEKLLRAGRLSMLEIAIEAGFGSKASFNRAFKLHAGMTPTQFVHTAGEDTD